MIKIKQIRGGSDYMKHYLLANDYYSEGESVVGEWKGKLAEKFGLEGKDVVREVFEALSKNLHPSTEEKLRPRSSKVTFHDVVISAPKSYSVVALVGGDERLVEGFERASAKAFNRLEKYLSVRDRSGNSYHTENEIRTGNGIAATFLHDTNRLLEPNLHQHVVFSNHSWCEEKGSYYALQPKTMMNESKRWITDQFHRDLAKEAIAAGYKVELIDNRVRLTELSLKTEMLYSQRTVQRQKFEQKYRTLFGNEPSKKRIEQFIAESKPLSVKRFKSEYEAKFNKAATKKEVEDFVEHWRPSKMTESSSEKVYQMQRAKLSNQDRSKLDSMVKRARGANNDEKEVLAEEKAEETQDMLLEDHYDEETQRDFKYGSNTEHEIKAGQRGKQLKRQAYEHAVDRMEAIRRMRRGMALAQALRGHPMVFMIQQLSTLTKNAK